ncbi:sensor histidine kinase [Streptomyces zagrosensis]|uniref:histidine kinase n=1 Tax=Streptomyces zagrosensis TaxID=1042984 RepID=A0A7W9Q6B0_9ACTN|nr:histidine kinase [Streptomyces zagrosensis]MBB5933913.1 signal transduction histidine kinase [Streptomyces zagrosensis]
MLTRFVRPWCALGSLGSALAATLVIGAAFPDELPVGLVAVAMAGGCVGGRWSRYDRLARWAFGAVAAAGLPVVLLAGHDGWQWVSLLAVLGGAVVTPWALGRGWRRQVERGQAAAAETARLRERNRIAEDMHDSLGHDLSLIALRAGALELGLAGPQQDAAGEVREAAASATERLRDIIGVLHDGAAAAPRAPAGDIGHLIEGARAAGVRLTLHDEAGELPGDLAVTAHRVVQEGLTNAAKHAPRAAVEVRLARKAGALCVSVANGGRSGAAHPPVSGGVGLVALGERVRLAGGSLTASPQPSGGWLLTAVLPL